MYGAAITALTVTIRPALQRRDGGPDAGQARRQVLAAFAENVRPAGEW